MVSVHFTFNVIHKHFLNNNSIEERFYIVAATQYTNVVELNQKKIICLFIGNSRASVAKCYR